MPIVVGMVFMFLVPIAMVMYLAKRMKTERTGLGYILLASILIWVITGFWEKLSLHGTSYLLVLFILAPLVYRTVLGTTFSNGVILSLVATIISMSSILVMAAMDAWMK